MSSRSRPASVTWLSLGLLAVGIVYLIRFAGGLTAPDLPLSVPRWYPPITGAIWGIAWCVVAAAAYTGRRQAPRMIAAVGGAFLAWYWFDRMAFVRSAYALRSLPFSIGLTVLGALLLVIILRRPSVRGFFGE